MSKNNTDFTKVATNLLVATKGIIDWGIDEGHTTNENLRLTIAARGEQAKKLIEDGMSQRKAAKVLGVHRKTIGRDLAQKAPKSGAKGATKKKRPAPVIDIEGDSDPGIEDDLNEDPENYRTAFLLRADQSKRCAVYSGPVTDEIVAVARAVAAAWQTLAQRLEKYK